MVIWNPYMLSSKEEHLNKKNVRMDPARSGLKSPTN